MLILFIQPVRDFLDCHLHLVQGLARVDDGKSLRLRISQGKISFPNPGVKVGFFDLEPISGTPAPCPVHADLCRRIEQYRQVGLQFPLHPIRECIDLILIEPTPIALLGPARVRKSVAYHPPAGLERRPDGIADMQ